MDETTPKAILIDVIDSQTPKDIADKRLEELESLVKTFGGVVVVKTLQKRGQPDYHTYVGKGKFEELLELARELKVKFIIVNNLLKPGQLYNLNELALKDKVEVWDRIELILNIFDKHAQSTEAKLQIELARIKHIGPRIFGLGMELSRQEGKTGVRSGQGESNIEMMKRHLRKQELKILEKLKHYELIRHGHRIRRRRENFKTVALVGYTNAGKSSLMNALTGKDVYIADALFATLDTRVGRMYFEKTEKIDENGRFTRGKELLISDTIGFIQDLPPSLIQAFKSTLAETVDSDLLMHVIDVTDPHIDQKIEVVEEILKQLGLEEKPKLYVFNKLDMLKKSSIHSAKLAPSEPSHTEPPLRPPGVLLASQATAQLLGWHTTDEDERDKSRLSLATATELRQKYASYSPIFVSAHTKLNLDELKAKLEEL